MLHMIHVSPMLDKLKHFQQVLSYRIQLTTSQKVVLWSLGVVGTSAVVVGVLSRYLARRRAKPIFNPRIQRAINKRLSRMRSPNGGMGSVASSGGRSSPLGFSERLSMASGSIGSGGGGDAAPLSPQQLGVMDAIPIVFSRDTTIKDLLTMVKMLEMAPPKKILRRQQEVMLDFLEQNLDMAKGTPLSSPMTSVALKEKWMRLTKKLNSVEGGDKKPVKGWKRYWFTWRHRCSKKAENVHKLKTESPNDLQKFLPLDEIEIRVLRLNQKRTMKSIPVIEFIKQDSDSDQGQDQDQDQEQEHEPIQEVSCIQQHTFPVQVQVKELKNRRPTNGMEALETSINYWEDALAAFSVGARGGVSGTLALTSPEEAEFCREIQDLLQNAYLLQERCELLFLDQRSVLFRSESGGGAAEGSAPRRTRLLSSHTASEHTRKEHHSSAESFASAEDQVADLREFDDLTESVAELENLELYQTAVKQLEVGIPYRTLRTEVVQCGSDTEFLCKLHCLRVGFQHALQDASVRAWFVDAGRQVLTDLLLFADKEPKEFLVAYEEMVSWTNDPANWSAIVAELTSKGVKVVSFYDVVLDYILLDAFEDLAAPPASVLAVVRNRWLSDGFKESALTTAVWSVIKAKRRYLKYPNGFMSHFYSISEHLLPVLVWGFLGPRERLRDVCETFQAEIVGYVTDLFSFQKCRYTTVDEFTVDIMQHARTRAANITDKLAERV